MKCKNCGSDLLFGRNNSLICLDCHYITHIERVKTNKVSNIVALFSCIMIIISITGYYIITYRSPIFYDKDTGLVIVPKYAMIEKSDGLTDFSMDYLPDELMGYNYNIIVVNETYSNPNKTQLYGVHTFNDLIFLMPDRDGLTLLHEIGHRVYSKNLTREDKLRWKNISNTDNNSISDYGNTDMYEDFAESFMCMWTPDDANYKTVRHGDLLKSEGCRQVLQIISPERYEFVEYVNNKIMGVQGDIHQDNI